MRAWLIAPDTVGGWDFTGKDTRTGPQWVLQHVGGLFPVSVAKQQRVHHVTDADLYRYSNSPIDD